MPRPTSCSKCGSDRILYFHGHCVDSFNCRLLPQGYRFEGYVPSGLNIGGGYDIQMDLCLECGHAQGEWPRPSGVVLEAILADD